MGRLDLYKLAELVRSLRRASMMSRYGTEEFHAPDAKTRITYYLESNAKVTDLTVARYVDDSGLQALEDTRDHVLSLFAGALKRDGEQFVRWWVVDEHGNVLESHDELVRPEGLP